MPKEGESPSVGWRAVYNEMGVSTVADSYEWHPLVDEHPLVRTTTADTQMHDDE
jgi:hypothetical protein